MSRTLRVLCAAWLAVLVLGPQPARSGEDAASLAERARAELANESTWPRAIELYEQALEQDPDLHEARRGLARVLSWSRAYDASLRHYEVLIGADPADAELRVERAEVSSWAGRYASAERELEAVLEQHPDHAGALRALARSQSWRGAKSASERTYRRALAIEADPELEQEWRELRIGFGPTAGVRAVMYADNGDFSQRELHAEASGWYDLDTQWLARAGVVHGSHDQDDVDLRIRNPFDSDRAPELEVEVRRLLRPGMTLIGEAGVRAWRRAGTRPQLRLGIETESDRGWSWTTTVAHRDLIDLVHSFEALQEDLTHTGLTWTGYRSLPARLGFFGKLAGGRVNDGNVRLEAIGSLDWSPLDEHELSLGLGASALRYSDEELSYYSPRLDAGAGVSARYARVLPANLSLEVSASLGAGRSDTRDGGASSGAVGGADARLRWTVPGWSAELYGAWFSARGGEGFESREIALRVERSF